MPTPTTTRRDDFTLTNPGTDRYVLIPLTRRAARWCRHYWPEQSCAIGMSITIDAADIRGVVAGILRAGLQIQC